jgi:hypothetical protein
MEEIVTPGGRAQIVDNAVLIIRIAPDVEQTLELAKAQTEAIHQFVAGRRLGVILDIRTAKRPSTEVQRFYSDQNGKIAGDRPMAVLVGSPMSRIMGNLFIGMSRSKNPVKLFTSEQEAIAWAKPN